MVGGLNTFCGLVASSGVQILSLQSYLHSATSKKGSTQAALDGRTIQIRGQNSSMDLYGLYTYNLYTEVQ